jgi:ribonuclease HI
MVTDATTPHNPPSTRCGVTSVIANRPTDTVWNALPSGIALPQLPTAQTPPSVHSLAMASAISEHPSVPDALAANALRQYLLVCHARSISINQGTWCFSLESISGEPILDAECDEEGDLNRLSLLAAVRGLESIDGRGLVSLISNNRYLIRSLDRALPRWRENDFVWEQFGRKMPVQNADLWRRIDRTLGIHSVTASLLQSTRVSTGDTRFEAVMSSRTSGNDAAPMMRFDNAHSPTVPSPSDGLRRWLVGNCDAAPIVSRRTRYRSAEVARA